MIIIIRILIYFYNWGLGIGDWGLGKTKKIFIHTSFYIFFLKINSYYLSNN